MTRLTMGRRLFLGGAAGAFAAGAMPRRAFALGEEVMMPTLENQTTMTPFEAIERLQEGNARFVAHKDQIRDDAERIELTAHGQFPFAAIVSCIDSRVSGELIFDQGIGDIFTSYVAGNFVDDVVLGGLEFACALSGAKAIVVVGHTECGAVKGACDDVIFGNLTQTLSYIKPAVAAVEGFEADRTSANPDFVQAVADKNVVLTVAKILDRSPILRDMAEAGDIALGGAMYDVATGEATFNEGCHGCFSP